MTDSNEISIDEMRALRPEYAIISPVTLMLNNISRTYTFNGRCFVDKVKDTKSWQQDLDASRLRRRRHYRKLLNDILNKDKDEYQVLIPNLPLNTDVKKLKLIERLKSGGHITVKNKSKVLQLIHRLRKLS